MSRIQRDLSVGDVMLVSFSVENYRSFHKEQTLRLIAHKKLAGQHDDHAVEIPGSSERVLKTAVIYGANGAGKSNLFKAIEFLARAAVEVRRKGTGTGRQAFRFGNVAEDASQFDIQFISRGALYRYGLVVDDQHVVEEWLLKVTGSREASIYERMTDAIGNVTIALGQKKRKSGGKMQAIATVGGPANQSFLATVKENLDEEDMSSEVRDVLDWFDHQLMLVNPDGPVAPIGHFMSVNQSFADFASEFLRASSTGVEGLEVQRQEITQDQLKSIMGKRAYSVFSDQIDEMDVGEATVLSNGMDELLIEKGEESHFYRLSVQASHVCANGERINLALNEESDGTRRLLDLMPALHRSSVPKVFFIDEIERSLHPTLMKRFMEYFLSATKNEAHQIVVTTHESHLLDLDLLRRDEIWFAEKGHDLDTHLYSLGNFKVRTDLEIRKNYLAGRFGAIPFLGDIDRLAGASIVGELHDEA